MTLEHLIDAVIDECETALEPYWYAEAADGDELGDETVRVPTVYDWGPDPQSLDVDAEDHPWVGVRLLEGEDSDVGGTANVQIVVAAYGDDPQGYREVLGILQAVRTRIHQVQRLEAASASLQPGLGWRIAVSPEAEPYWQGEITATYSIPRPRMLTNWED